jgi:glycerate dehydrogenase
MKIVVLDGYTVTQADLSFDFLNAYGEAKIYERMEQHQAISRIGDAEIVLTNKAQLTREIMEACPKMKYISVLATGFNVVDIAAARDKGITVSNVPAYSTESVAQHTFALILELLSSAGPHNTAVKAGDWTSSGDFCFCLGTLKELSNKTLGLIGYGNIGKAVERIARAFNMKVLVNNRTPFPGSVNLETVLKESDIVSLHCPLTDKNAKFINADALSEMKRGAYLINTARGGLIDEAALANALNEGRIAGAGLDVLSTEPPDASNPLLSAKNCIITPHIAWATLEARKRLLQTTEQNVKGFVENKPINVVS